MDHQHMTETVRYLATGAVDAAAGEDDAARKISWIFSNEDVCLDQHTISAAGWELDDYLRNPVLLFAHDQNAPPVGRVTRIEKRGALLVGDTVFADAETFPFADTIYRLVKGRFLNATSVSWFPLEFKPARDRSRPEGIDFLKQKLLEISVVPVPANPAALATARNLGIDTSPLREWAERILDGASLAIPRAAAATIYRETQMPVRATKESNWKCGASRNLPLDEDSDWDGPAAQKAVFEACGFDGDKPDLAKARKAFLVYDAANPKLKGSYKLPFATTKGGRLTAVAAGLRAAASRLPQTDIPDDVRDSARAVIDHYEGKMTKEKDSRALVTKRGLYAVSNLAYLLAMAGSIKSDVDYEEAAEGDADSPNPANMLAVLHALGKAMIDMAAEEVAELLASFDPVDAAGAERALAAMAFTRAGKRLARGDKEELEDIQGRCARGTRMLRALIDDYSGGDEDLSDDDTRAAMFDRAEAVHDQCARAADQLRAHIDGRAPPEDGDGAGNPPANPPDDDARSAAASAEERRRKAAALRAKDMIYGD
jgi:hypothetical protein